MKAEKKEAYLQPLSSLYTLMAKRFLCTSMPVDVEDLEEEGYEWES